eukprot:754494-Hanusia_phi.AAC.2
MQRVAADDASRSPLLGIRKALLRKQSSTRVSKRLIPTRTPPFLPTRPLLPSEEADFCWLRIETTCRRGYEYMNDAKRDAEKTLEIYKKVSCSRGKVCADEELCRSWTLLD